MISVAGWIPVAVSGAQMCSSRLLPLLCGPWQNCLVSLTCFDRRISEAPCLCHLGVSIYQSPFAADKYFQRVVAEVGL